MSLPAMYAWAIQVVREDESPVGQREVVPDFEPACEWVRWLAVRAGRPPEEAFTGECGVAPIWDDTHGEPRLGGIRVTASGSEHAFGLELFRDPGRSTVARMVEEGALAAGDLVRWRALAFAREPSAIERAPGVGRVAPPPVPVRPLRRPGIGDGEPGAEADDPPVFIPATVLAEVGALTLGATGRETGGILLGYLGRDVADGIVFGHVTAQVPARHTAADATRLTFTPDTWTAVRSAIALRRQDEIMLGWWHSHPVREWCRHCPETRRRDCALGRGFLSADDRLLHRTVFPRAFSLALVASDVSDEGPEYALFGWRRGLLEPRAFHRIEGGRHERP